MGTLVVAVDGGASKTEVMVVAEGGQVLGRARGGPSNHQLVGLDQAVATIASLVAQARAAAGADGGRAHCLGIFCLAGLDLAIDEQRLVPALKAAGLVDELVVRNDTFAILRAGVTSGFGVATVCGTGLNCVGLGPSGASVRFASLGELSGDFTPGGMWLGTRALGLALRAGDGRGAATSLVERVAGHFELSSPLAVLEGVYSGAVAFGRLAELARVLLDEAAGGDTESLGAARQLAAEVVAMTTAAIGRLDLAGQAVEVVLGGGIFATGCQAFTEAVHGGIHAVAPRAVIGQIDVAPVIGAALLGLDRTGASAAAKARLRAPPVARPG